jgi:hypothetical protein
MMIILGLLLGLMAKADDGGWESLKATYEVPAPAALAPYAHFSDLVIKRREVNGKVQYYYDLPQELTGHPVRLDLNDVDGRGLLFRSSVSEMSCSGSDCETRYPGLKLDAGEVRSYLSSRGVSGAELDARMQVFARFEGGDPAGVIHFLP